MEPGKESPKKEPPKTVAEVYERLDKTAYAQLRTCKHTCSDVANLMIQLDWTLYAGVMCFETGADKYKVFVATEGGIWKEQAGTGMIAELVNKARSHIDTKVLSALRTLVCWMRSTATEDDKVRAAEKEYEHVDKLHTKLGTAFEAAVVSKILKRKATWTREQHYELEKLDTRPDCIGFEDGVYDFGKGELVRGAAAHEYQLTKTVGYEYADVQDVSEATMSSFDAFFEQIHGTAAMRAYLLRRFRSAARKMADQVVLVHYNVAGSNGKSTFFGLVAKTFGALYVTCAPTLLVAASLNNPSAANEELMSIRGTSVVLFSEPSTTTKLSASFLKKLTGGDEQASRHNYGRKATFTFSGLANILCNKIPELDDMDGGMERRLKCVPYASTFVDPGSARVLGPEARVFLKDKGVTAKFAEWRLCLMKRILETLDTHADEEPDEVKEHTAKLIEREDVLSQFVKDRVERAADPKAVLKRADLWIQYGDYCRGKHAALKFTVFNAEIERHLGEPHKKSGGVSNFWRGFKLATPEHSEGEDEDELA